MLKTAVFGASGYTGLELLRILLRHPRCEITAISSRRYEGQSLGAAFPALRGFPAAAGLKFEAPNAEAIAPRCEAAFLCLPHASAAPVAAVLHQCNVLTVDLSADFRLRDRAAYEKWYGPHQAPQLLGEAVYGLPEFYRAEISRARLIAAPGCYPTGALLPLLPLLRAGAVQPRPIIVDAKSGVSGAGRSLQAAHSLAELGENAYAYKVAAHRHIPEITQEAAAAAGAPAAVTMVPHLLPVIRGIATSVYVRPQNKLSAAEARALLAEAYAEAPFVRVLPPGETPQLAHVRGGNFCDIAVFADENADLLILLSALDNLVKGAAGQAVQCLNIAQGWDETCGLMEAPLSP